MVGEERLELPPLLLGMALLSFFHTTLLFFLSYRSRQRVFGREVQSAIHERLLGSETPQRQQDPSARREELRRSNN